MTPADIIAAREKLGDLWGFGRALKMAELGRALGYDQSQRASENISRYENGEVDISPPVRVAIEMMLDGAKPRNFNTIRPSSYKKIKNTA